MEAAINPSLSFDDSLLKGRPDWIHMLKNWDHQHHTMISIYDTSKDYFIFFNQSVTSILGYRTCHFHQFKAQDWISMIHQKEQSRAVEFLFNTTPSQNGKILTFNTISAIRTAVGFTLVTNRIWLSFKRGCGL